jgi:hypothetical protein
MRLIRMELILRLVGMACLRRRGRVWGYTGFAAINPTVEIGCRLPFANAGRATRTLKLTSRLRIALCANVCSSGARFPSRRGLPRLRTP